MAVTWNAGFEQTPSGADSPSQGDDRIRELKEAVRERVNKEHKMNPLSGAASEDGWHKAGSAMCYTGASAPTTRPDGTTALTADDDGRLWISTDDFNLRAYRHAAGSTAADRWEVVSGAGGSGENFIQNNLTKPGLAGVNAVGDNSLEWDDTATDILNVGALKVDFLSTGTGRYMDLDLNDLDANNVGQPWMVKFSYKLANNADDLVTVFLYDGSVEIPLAISALPYAGGTLQNAGGAVLPTTVLTGVKLRFKFKDSTAITFYLADVSVGPYAPAAGGAIGNAIEYTPSVKAETSDPTLGTVDVHKASYTRVGGDAIIRWHLHKTSGGTSGTGNYYINLPPGLTIDMTKLLNGSSNQFMSLGTAVIRDNTGAEVFAGYARIRREYNDRIYAVVAVGTNSYAAWSSTVGNIASSADREYFIEVRLPIAEWTSNVNLATDFQEFASNSSATDADDTTSFVYGPGGSPVPSGTITAQRKKRCRFIRQRGPTDLLVLEVLSTQDNGWSPLTALTKIGVYYLQPLRYTGASYQGIGWSPVAGSNTDIDVVFGAGAAETGTTWANLTSEGVRWRVRKVSNGNMAEIPPTVYAEYSGSAADAVDSPIDYDVKIEDTHNAVTTGTSWKFTAPIDGLYSFAMSLFVVNSAASTISIHKNGVLYKDLMRAHNESVTHLTRTSGMIRLAKGDYIHFELDSSTVSAGTRHVEIARIGS